MCPSAWAIAGPSATWRTLHRARRPPRPRPVFAPPSVAPADHPGRAPAANSASEPTRSTRRPRDAVSRRARSATSAVEPPARRQERLALDAGVAAVGQPGARHQRAAPGRCDRVDPPAVLVGGDQVAGEAPERRRRHRDPALDLRRMAGDRAHPAAAVDRHHGARRAVLDRHEQPVAEPAGLVERDPVDQPMRRQGREHPHAAGLVIATTPWPAPAAARTRCPSRSCSRGDSPPAARCTAPRLRGSDIRSRTASRDPTRA